MSIKPTKREQHSEVMRKKILDAAEELFNQYGIERVSMKDVAAQVNVTTGALYHHFKNKDAIVDEIFMRHLIDFNEQTELLEQAEDPIKALYHFLIDVMGKRVLDDGMEFTRYRLFSIMRFERKGSIENNVGILVHKAREMNLIRKEWSDEEVTDLLVSIYRGAVYQYCVSTVHFDLLKMIEQRLSVAIQGILIEKR